MSFDNNLMENKNDQFDWLNQFAVLVAQEIMAILWMAHLAFVAIRS